MGSQSDHSQPAHNDHHQQHPHAQPHPFTDHELLLIEMANKHAEFEGHHHHHHHHGHVQYQRPHNIDTNLGLFALKKLNAIDPEFLPQKDKALLQPSAPGLWTHLAYGGLMTATGWYTFYAWKNLGFGFVLNPKVMLPLGALIGSTYGVQIVFNYGRELLWSFSRSNMVDSYKQKYGEKFLLDALQPTYRPRQASDSK